MTTQSIGREKTMAVYDVGREPDVTVSSDRTEAPLTVHHDAQGPAATTAVADREPSTTQATQTTQATEPERLAGDPRALLAARLLASAALLVTAFIHARLAFQLGVGGMPIGQGQLFFLQAVVSLILALAMFSRDSRVWLFALVLSVAGLVGILSSVYFPVPSLGPLPAIDEPVWLMTKAVSAFAEVTVIALWGIRQIAPSSQRDPSS
jgi:hypothetical protein